MEKEEEKNKEDEYIAIDKTEKTESMVDKYINDLNSVALDNNDDFEVTIF